MKSQNVNFTHILHFLCALYIGQHRSEENGKVLLFIFWGLAYVTMLCIVVSNCMHSVVKAKTSVFL